MAQQTIDFISGADVANGVAITADGKIVLAGSREDPGDHSTLFALSQADDFRALDTTFDSDGKLTTTLAMATAAPPAWSSKTMGESWRRVIPEMASYFRGHSIRGVIRLEERIYALQDANFNMTAVADPFGNVIERYQYDPYGKVTILDANWSPDADSTSDWGWQYLHQGGRLDSTSGLYYFRNRDLSSTMGKWMQQDPTGYADGLNLYLYVKAIPVESRTHLV